MEELNDNFPKSEELKDAMKQLESCTTEELEIMAKRLRESTKFLYGKNEIVTAVAVLLKARRAYAAPLN